jgi:DNA-binding NarL/FixJ family response regulator
MLAEDRVLVVEDEPLVAEGLRDLFAEAEEMPVRLASSVSSGRSLRPRALVRSEGD